MSAPTVAVRQALAQAGEKGLVHLAAQQNTGTWLGRCGRQIRGRDIRIREGREAVRLGYEVERAEQEGRAAPVALCPDCAEFAAAVGQAVIRAEALR